MSDDLRTRIAAAIRREVPCHPPAADRIADAMIRELPELQPCPFCGLSHNRCDCLRSTDERT